MIYRPAAPRQLWDTWLFRWEGRYHLFHLETHEHLWDHVGHAVSDDLVHWSARPSIPTKGAKGEWNHEPTLTGMVVRHNDLFYMFVGAEHQNVQVVGVYTSSDLDHWTPHPANPVMKPAGPHYLDKPAPPEFPNVDWRDPCITYSREDGCYYALLCARKPQWSHADTGAVIARLRSKDLIRWELLPPLAAVGDRFYHTEVPDVFELEGRHYLAFATVTWGGIRLQTASRDSATGTFYMTGRSAAGPFELPEESLLIGSGHARLAAYVGRTMAHDQGRLLYHHINCARPAWGTPKMIRSRADGSLFLQYMPVLEKLETGIVVDGNHVPVDDRSAADLGQWRRSGNDIVGLAKATGTSRRIARQQADLHVQCQIQAGTAARAGLLLRAKVIGPAEFATEFAVVVMLDFERQEVRAEIVRRYPIGGWGSHFGHVSLVGGVNLLDSSRQKLARNVKHHLRCFCRDEHLEVYLDDRWIMSPVITEAARSGDLLLAVERGEASFMGLRVATLEPLE